MFQFFELILTDKTKAIEYTDENRQFEENELVTIGSNLNKEVFYNYNQFLKYSIKKYFTDDAFDQLISVLDDFKVTNHCEICYEAIRKKESIKICQLCFNIHHLNCLAINKVSTKLVVLC